MSPRRTTVALGIGLLASLACGDAFAQAGASTAGGRMAQPRMSMPGPEHDAMFMRHAAADGLAEVELGRIALERASSTQVRQLAQRIVDDHTKANQQLMEMARRKQVTLPTEPAPMHKREAERLRGLSGSAFDQAYAQAMVGDHRKAIRMFDVESRSATDSGLRQFAGTTLPVLKTHLQLAEQAAGRVRAHDTPMDGSGAMPMPPSGSSTR